MSNMTTVIKDIVGGYINNLDICNLELGVVVSSDPVKIRISNGMVLPKSIILLPENLVREEYRVRYLGEDRKIKFTDKKLEIDDKVIMIKGVGGEKYLVIDRVI